MTTVFETLKSSPLFKNVAFACLLEMEKTASVKHFKESDVIIADGEKGGSLFLLKRGSVSVIKKLTLLDTPDRDLKDKELILLKAEHNDFFGEMVLCSDTDARSATVRANTDCEVVEMFSDDIHRVLEKYPESGALFYRNLASLLAERLRKSNRDIVKLTTALTLALEDS